MTVVLVSSPSSILLVLRRLRSGGGGGGAVPEDRVCRMDGEFWSRGPNDLDDAAGEIGLGEMGENGGDTEASTRGEGTKYSGEWRAV